MLTGDTLGPYRVLDKLGEGGMGAVFRARDTKLDRDVAIKILPEAFANDADRLARFTREAKVLASLNHPHIAGIYGLETGPALPGQPAPPAFIVMELVEGEDLSTLIARHSVGDARRPQAQRPSPNAHGLPVDEALPIAKQIAEALEAAHEQGIIHRDLKPANIKVRADGQVKVLDFGLAKAIDRPDGAAGVYRPDRPGRPGLPDLSASPTITSPAMLTGAGMILGTAAYMAPEQARGKTVDRRADIWAFGAVLFEMLTGQRAFPGEDLADTLGSVVKRDPAWDALPTDVPVPVRTLLQACLVKDPRQRVADISTALFVLDKTASLAAVPTTAPPTTPTSSSSRGRLVWMAACAAATVVIAAMAVPTLRHLRETPPPPPPETRVDIVTPATDLPASFALSPDGRQIVFVATGDGGSRLWLRSLATTTAQPLAGTEGASAPFW